MDNLNVLKLHELYLEIEELEDKVLLHFKKYLLPKYANFYKENKKYMRNCPGGEYYCYFENESIKLSSESPDDDKSIWFSLNDIVSEESFYKELKNIVYYNKKEEEKKEEKKHEKEGKKKIYSLCKE